MTTRNIKQQGQAYGSTPAAITAYIDGVVVYNGPVDTVNEPIPQLPAFIDGKDLFSWTVDSGYTGTQTMVIQVTGSPLILTDTEADHQVVYNLADYYLLAYNQVIDGVSCLDPFTSVMIADTIVTRSNTPDGQWYWLVQPGQSFQATVNIVAGIDYPTWNPAESYPINSTVAAGGFCWSALRGPVPPGMDPTQSANWSYWSRLPVTIWQIGVGYATGDDVIAPTGVARYKALQAVPAGTSLDDTAFWSLYS